MTSVHLSIARAMNFFLPTLTKKPVSSCHCGRIDSYCKYRTLDCKYIYKLGDLKINFTGKISMWSGCALNTQFNSCPSIYKTIASNTVLYFFFFLLEFITVVAAVFVDIFSLNEFKRFFFNDYYSMDDDI